jgi:hypothetical protein
MSSTTTLLNAGEERFPVTKLKMAGRGIASARGIAREICKSRRATRYSWQLVQHEGCPGACWTRTCCTG